LKKGECNEETFRKTNVQTRGRSKEETFPEAESLPVLHGQEIGYRLQESKNPSVFCYRTRKDHPSTDFWQLCEAPAGDHGRLEESPEYSHFSIHHGRPIRFGSSNFKTQIPKECQIPNF
jgi:hypothetical protein